MYLITQNKRREDNDEKSHRPAVGYADGVCHGSLRRGSSRTCTRTICTAGRRWLRLRKPPNRTPASPIDTLTVGTTASIETAVFGEYNFDMLASGVSELPLVYQDTKGEYHPLLAAYSTEDAATWTYTIQDGMTWSDGEPVTAEDILFTLQYDQANGSANFEAQTAEDGKVTEAKYTGYTISDDMMSISLTLASPNVRELSNMTSFRVMPKHVYEGKDTVTDEEARITCALCAGVLQQGSGHHHLRCE